MAKVYREQSGDHGHQSFDSLYQAAKGTKSAAAKAPSPEAVAEILSTKGAEMSALITEMTPESKADLVLQIASTPEGAKAIQTVAKASPVPGPRPSRSRNGLG